MDQDDEWAKQIDQWAALPIRKQVNEYATAVREAHSWVMAAMVLSGQLRAADDLLKPSERFLAWGATRALADLRDTLIAHDYLNIDKDNKHTPETD